MQLKMEKSKPGLNQKALEKLVLKENKFITNLFSMVAFPERCEDEQEEENSEPAKFPHLHGEKKSRAVTIEDLQKRLEAIQSKRNPSYKEKLQKKGLKKRMKKKSKHAQHKILRAKTTTVKAEDEEETKPPKPVYNSEGKMVFSKFDFSGLGKEKSKKQEKDPKKILQNLQKQKEKLEQLEAEGERERAVEIKEKSAWRSAIAKAQGEKVKDDPELLKKSVKKKEQKQKQSKKKWEQRIDGVKKQKEERQKKRTDNIEKRKKDKKVNKMKHAAKRGRIIPGF